MNVVILVGEIANAPEYRVAGNSGFMSLRVVTKRGFADKSGEWREVKQFHNAVWWGKDAETAHEAGTLYEGAKVAIEGSLENRSYEKNGTKVWVTEVRARSVTSLGGDVASKPQSRGQATQDDMPW